MTNKDNQVKEIVKKKLEEIKFVWAHRAKERADILGRKEPTITIEQAHEDLDMVLEIFQDSVVVSKEEYVKEINEKEELARGNIALHNEVDALHRINYELKEELKQTHKGMAENIFNKITKECKYCFAISKEPIISLSELKNFAAREGIEIKE